MFLKVITILISMCQCIFFLELQKQMINVIVFLFFIFTRGNKRCTGTFIIIGLAETGPRKKYGPCNPQPAFGNFTRKNSEALYREFILEIILIRQVREEIHLCCSASYWISLCFM